LALELVAPGGGGNAATPSSPRSPSLDRADLQLAGQPGLHAPPATSTLVPKVTKFEPSRGGAVELSVDGNLGNAEVTWRLHADVSTYVRDVVTLEALYDVGSHRFGAGPEMR
jgi:hypothetical protein